MRPVGTQRRVAAAPHGALPGAVQWSPKRGYCASYFRYCGNSGVLFSECAKMPRSVRFLSAEILFKQVDKLYWTEV